MADRIKHSTDINDEVSQEDAVDRNIYSDLFWAEHVSGDTLYPYRIWDRETGTYVFYVGKISTKNPHTVKVEDEKQMARLVLEENYKVRMRDPNNPSRHGGYRMTGHSIVRVHRRK
jgi:hypothetical protein